MPSILLDTAEPPLVLVLDAGSSSLRGALYDARARAVDACEVREPHSLHVTADGGVEEDADEVTERVAAVIDRVLAAAGRRATDIAAVGMASFASTLVGVDAAGAAVTPVYAYSDTRPAAEVHELRARLDEEAVHQRTGCRLHTSYLPARLLWLERTRSDAHQRVTRWLSLPEYVYLRFLGTTHASYSIAAWSGLLDRRTLEWDREWLEELQLEPARLSPIAETPLGGLAGEYADRWPALARAAWFPAVADGVASNIGSDCDTPAGAALAMGTSGALRVVTADPPDVLPPGLWCYRVDRRRALVGGALNQVGGVIAWARAVFRLDEFEQIERAAGAAEPDGHGLTVLPFLTGERSPGWNADIRAAVVGIEAHTGPADILQALMEAVAYRFGLVWRELVEAIPGIERVVASGGPATGSPVWVQMIAGVLGRPVTLLDEPEATSRGVAVLALQALRGDTACIAPAEMLRTFAPDPGRHARYQAAMARQQELYRRLADWSVETKGA